MNGNMLVKNIGELVTCSGFAGKTGTAMAELGIVRNGAVVIEDGVIIWVGRYEEMPSFVREDDFVVVDAEEKAVLPGFVDSHTHFIFSGYREEEFCQRLAGAGYMEIMARGGGIVSTVVKTRQATLAELCNDGRSRLNSMLSFGVTTVEGKSGYGLDLKTELKQLEAMEILDHEHPVDIIATFLGAHAVPQEFKGNGDAFLEFLDREVLPVIIGQGFAEFCDIFCEQGVFSVEQSRRFLREAKKHGLKIKVHADEIVRLGGAELAAELQAVSADHLLHASQEGLARMAEAGVVATVLPLTAFSLREPYADARNIIDAGCCLALATDMNPGSCFSESIPMLFALAVISMNLTPEEAIIALTVNGAAALDRADRIGSIDVGKQADMIILQYPSYRFIPYHLGVNTVERVIKRGCLVYDSRRGGKVE